MNLNELKEAISSAETLQFMLPSGAYIPPHFHLTEIGTNTRRFVDCGGNLRETTAISMQLYLATDYDHRLSPSKFISIIEKSEAMLALQNLSIEVEFQGQTIERYKLAFDSGVFILEPLTTDCLDKDKCGIPQAKPRIRVSTRPELQNNGCAPGSSCC